MYTKRYHGGKVVASTYFKRRNNLLKVSSNGHTSSNRQVHSSRNCKNVPIHPYAQYAYAQEMYGQQQSVRFAEPDPRQMAQMMQMDEDESPYDELDELESLQSDRLLKKKKQDETRNRMKMIFAALMLPSLIALFNSHKKMNKGSESNIDIDALKSGAFPGFPGMAGGAMGGAFGGGHRHSGIHPDFERDFEQMQHESPSAKSGDADANAKKASAQEYAERLMAQYGK